MNKRAIAILGGIFILIVGTLGFLIYQRQHRKSTAATPAQTAQQQTPAPSTPTNTTPPASGSGSANSSAKAIKLTDDEVVSPVLFFQGNGITYFNSQGQLFQTDLQSSAGNVLLSNKRELTIALKAGISKVLWPQSGNNFIAQFDSGSSHSWSFYDSDKGAYTDLPKGIESLDWLPAGNKIMLVYVDNSGKATLNISNPDGSGYQTISPMYEPDDQISVSPDGKSLLFWRTQNRDAKNIISFLSPDGKVYKALIQDGYNLGVKWSPDSSKFLFGKRDPQTQAYQLWVANLATGQAQSLGVNTIPDKAVWAKDGSVVYAAIPASGGSGLSQDTVMKINISSLAKQEYPPGVAIDAQDLLLSADGNTLFFKNNQDRSLYYIDVSK